MGWHHLIVFDRRADNFARFENRLRDFSVEVLDCLLQVVGQLKRSLKTPKRLNCVLCGAKVSRDPSVVIVILPDDLDYGEVEVPTGCLCEACVAQRTSDQVRDAVRSELRRHGVVTEDYVMSPPTALQ